MPTVDLNAQAAFDALLSHVVGDGCFAEGRSAQQIAMAAKAEGKDAAEAASRLIAAGFGVNHEGSWRGVINQVLGVATLFPDAARSGAAVSSGPARATAAAPAAPVRPASKAKAAPPPAPAPARRLAAAAPAVSGMPIVMSTFPAPAPAPVAKPAAAAAAIPSVDGWAAEYRASPALQAEYLTEASFIAARRHDARRAGQRFNPHSAAEADRQTDPHVAAWMRDPALQAEFVTAASYSALKRAEAAGRVRTAGSRGGRQ